MSVKVRPYRNRGWEVDIQAVLPDGSRKRVRRKAPVASRSEAVRWGHQRLRELLFQVPKPKKEAPTIAEFTPRFLDGYARANRHKPSGIAAKETILRVHIIPLLGHKRLDQVNNEDVQALKTQLGDKAPKTVNNVLSVLSMLLKVAEEWSLIEHAPCRVRLVRTPPTVAQFHDFDQYERLVRAGEQTHVNAHLVVLLGGEAGLRCGEMMALEWTDVDLQNRQLSISRSEWRGHVTAPKGGRVRCVPLTGRLTRCLRAHRHLRERRVLCNQDGSPLTQKVVQGLVGRAARRALLVNDGVHTLRHTFCSHLAMRGAPARAIQELAGHKDLSTTQRYMHLSPAAVQAAIQLLEHPSPSHRRGNTPQ